MHYAFNWNILQHGTLNFDPHALQSAAQRIVAHNTQNRVLARILKNATRCRWRWTSWYFLGIWHLKQFELEHGKSFFPGMLNCMGVCVLQHTDSPACQKDVSYLRNTQAQQHDN